MKKALAVSKLAVSAFALVGMVFFAGCGGGGSDRPASLTGYWIREYKNPFSGKDDVENVEFFKDGTGRWDDLGGTWRVENKRLIFLSPLMSMSYDYKISGYELTLVDDKGDTAVYGRRENFEEFKAKQAAKKAKQ